MHRLPFPIFVSIFLSSQSFAQEVTYKPINVPGALSTLATGINDRGDIIGIFTVDSTGNNTGFVLSDGVFRRQSVPGAVSTYLRGINSDGDTVGQYTDAVGITHGFLMTRSGTLTTIDVQGAAQGTVANGINDQQEIVGNYTDVAGIEHGFLFKEGQTRTFDPSNATFTVGFFISNNNAGALVGTIDDASGTHAFLQTNALVMAFNIPESQIFTSARAISSTGKIVGSYAFVAGASHGFLLDSGNITSIDFPKAINTTPRGINARDQIVGWYTDASGVMHGFMATISDQ